MNNQNLEDLETQHISDYSNKITLYNAKEKLLQHVKNSIVNIDQSNKWNLLIDIENVKMEEEEELKDVFRLVKQKEVMIMKTEMIMQQRSIYNETYKPLFINEMDEEKVKDFSKTLSQKLRHVKLAISKANLGQNKYSHMNDDEKKEAKIKLEPETKEKTEKSEKEKSAKRKKKLKPVK